MTLQTVGTRRALTRLTPPILSLLLGFGVGLPARLHAQCTLSSAPISFEPSPPGVSRPGNLAAAKNYDLVLFQSSGAPHMLMQESFGYSVLDVSNPVNPTALYYNNMVMSGEMLSVGDGQSYIGSIAVSPDGARLALGLNGNARPEYGSVAATANGNIFNSITGGFMPRNSATVVQGVGSRYLAYSLKFFPGALTVADITNIPGPLAPTNVSSEPVDGVGGNYLQLAGNNVLFLDTANTIRIYDASNPGPAGNIAGSFGRTTIGSADFPGGHTPTSFSAAVDPSDSTKLWVLVELSNPVSWAIVSIKGGAKTTYPPFAVPSPFTAGGVSALVPNGSGGLFALMWAKQSGSPVVYRLYSQSVQGWGTTPTPIQPDIDSNSYPTFGLNYFMRGLPGTGNLLYAYVPTGLSAYVLPLSCVSANAPAVASMAVTNQTGASLSDGATVFLGDTVTIAPSINPPTSVQPLTGFGWNFDFDFHAGVATEDNGSTASPRVHAPDNAAFGNPPSPPNQISVVGPCDPQVAGTSPGSGAGCWNSVKNNAAFAGGTADFTGAESPGATKALKFAFEANNALGSAGASTFTLNWKVPQVRLVTTQVLSGVALDATASDGHPSASGYKWYFGDSPTALTLDSSCTAATCVPTLQATGTPHYYWVTVPYSQIGYSTPDCPGAPNCTSSLGSYYVTNFAPAFTVNGAATGPVTAVAGQALTVSNSSQRGTTVTGAGGYYYSLCANPCSADNYVLWGAMGDAPPSGSPAYPATIPNPGVGSWLLKIKVIYTNPAGTAYWPDPAGAAGFTVNVTSCSNPTFHISAGGGPAYPSPGFAVQAGQSVTFVPDNVYPAPYSWSFGDGGSDTTQSPTHTYSTAGNYTVTFTAANGACSVSYAMVVTSVNPLSVSASANPNPAGVGANVNFSCSASGGSGGYTYAWSGSAFSGTVAGQSVSQSFSSVGTYSAQCNVTDSTSHLAGAVVTLTVQTGGSGNCTTADFHIVVDGGALYGAFSVIAGHVVTFYPNDIYSSYSWNFGDGATDASQVPTHTYSTPGTYTVSLTANGNCTRSYQIVVTGTSTGGPSSSGCNTVDFSILDVSTGIASCGPFGCSGISGAALSFVPNPAMSVSFTSWNFGDGSTSTTASTTHTYAGGGTFTITLTAGTCTKTRAISISGPVALSGVFNAKYSDNSAFVATQVASGKEISFLAIDTADSYTWDFGDGTSPASGQTPKHTYVTPGSAPFTYTVTLNVTRGTGTSAQNASTTQPFTIIPPPEPPKWFVAGMAYVQGALPGTLWQTDVTLFNPDQSRPAVYSLAFLDGRTSVDPATLVWKTINLGAQQSISSSNILAFFGQPLGSFGALLVRGDSAPVPPVVTARTFNIGDPTKGTFGLSVPTTQPSSGLTPQAALSQQFLIGLRDDDAAYTNLGLMNLTTDWSHARLTFLDGSGATTLGQVNVDVPPYGVAQLTRPLFAAPPNGVGFQDPLANFSVKVSVLSGGSVFPYATVIDRRSTDAVVVTVSDRPTSVYRMPGIIRLQGANGTVWRSRFYVTNPSATSRKVSISYSFVPCDETGCKSRVTGLQSDVSLLPGETLWTDDFPKVWLAGFGFGVSDTTAYQNAYVDVFPAAGDPNQEPVLVLGETYNDQPSGPVGLQVPGFTDADAASKTGANKRLLLSGLVSNDSYRSNVALFLQSGTSGRCTVRVLSEAGLEVARQDVAFNSTNTFVQLNDAGLFGSLPGSKDRLTVVIDSFDGSPISAYATIVDNTSGDATFLKAQPAP